MKKSHLVIAAAALAVLAGGVVAQVTAPRVANVSSSADLVQIIPNGAPTAQSVYGTVGQLTAAKGYYRSVPAAGFTFTFTNNQAVAAFDPAGTLATGTVTLASNPGDGLEECIFSTTAITTLTVNANSGATINDAVTTLAANAKVCYLYVAPSALWVRSQ